MCCLCLPDRGFKLVDTYVQFKLQSLNNRTETVGYLIRVPFHALKQKKLRDQKPKYLDIRAVI